MDFTIHMGHRRTVDHDISCTFSFCYPGSSFSYPIYFEPASGILQSPMWHRSTTQMLHKRTWWRRAGELWRMGLTTGNATIIECYASHRHQQINWCCTKQAQHKTQTNYNIGASVVRRYIHSAKDTWIRICFMGRTCRQILICHLCDSC